MSTITKEFTKEHLQQIIETDHVQCGEASALARIALASLEAEAVGEVIEQQSGMMLDGLVISEKPTYRNIKGIHNMKMMPLGTKFYTAPPAPVVPAPTSNSSSAFEDFWSNFEHPFAEDDELKSFASEIYRAAMLQGAEPVSNSDELPLDYLQGHKDGLEWAAQLAEANHPQTGDWLYDDPIDLAMAIRKGPDMPTVQGGNSPVTPDGWISCSEQMPSAGEQVLAYRPDAPESNDPLIKMATYVGGSAHGHGFDCYCKPTHWMPLPAAPQQEVNRG
ncbi:DUF551 domain-containing protein [Escherichia coli]|nr:DUF551 domain-containing protein [Escherichia coli]MCR4236294.1 DUF551 domain-containing protein [Escherichia coli]